MANVPSVALTALLSLLLTGLASWYASRAGLWDHPGERHSHTVSTPRGGGIGLVLSLMLVSTLWVPQHMPGYWFNCVAPGMAVLALLGWWDDHKALSARFRFLVQLAVCVFLLSYAWQAGFIGGAVPLVLAGLWVLWLTNLYNFMDGSNGMAGTQGLFAAAVLAWLYFRAGDPQSMLLCLLLAAACAGFLPWNLGRARVFMGDVGSLALGFIFAALILYGIGSGAFSLPLGLLVMALFLADSTLTLLARVIRGERWYNAHRQHLYQRLIARGWTHGRVLLVYQLINLVLILPGIVVAAKFPALAWPIALVMAMVLGMGWYGWNKRIGVLAQAG
jgi:Fuc2NAc and GlcNAc transferase